MRSRTLDHLVLPVVNLVEARARLTALGFTVAPDAHHPFGTANACVFLGDGAYLEPLALIDRRKAGLCAKKGNVFTERDLAFRGRKNRQGLSALVVASDDAAADHERYRQFGISAGAPLDFSRTMVSPDGDAVEARFSLAFAGHEASPDIFAFACQRLVAFPQDLGPLLSHPNAVVGLKEIAFACADPRESSAWLSEVLEAGPQDVEGGVVFQAGQTCLRVLDREYLTHDYGAAVDPSATGLMAQAIVLRTADLAVTEITLAANDVAFIRRGGRVLVSPARGQGVMFGFEE